MEYRKLFQDYNRGFFLSLEPQFSYLIYSTEKLIIRNNNILVTDETREFRNNLNNINLVLIFGCGYEFSFLKKLHFMLGAHIEFRPLWGYYKNESHIWASPGLSAGVRYSF